MIKDSKGFMLVELLAVVIVIVVVVFGFLILKDQNSNVNGDKAKQLVSNFYSQYLKVAGNANAEKKLLNQYGTSNLLFYNEYYLHDMDAIVCAQDLPERVVTSVASVGTVTTINVTEKSTGVADYGPIVIKVINDNGTLKIDGLTCPGKTGNLAPATQGF
jgi:type II secretory pathway pseudopilin PulG